MESEPHTPTEPTEPIEPDDTATAEPIIQQPKKSKRSRMPLMLALAGTVLVAALVASQVILIASIGSTRDDLEALQTQIAQVEDSVTDVDGSVADLATEVANIPPPATPSAAEQPISPAPAVPAGFLPRFTNGEPDAALGLTVPEITATEAYGQQVETVDPSDGTKRVWLVWSHWCPYCQQELPELAQWYPENAQRFPNSEFVTVTTSIDPSRGNPLDDYLAAEQFPFPVFVDADTTIAAQFGVSAFPFWVVTNGDGTVLFRTAGLIGIDAVEQLFTQLEQVDA